jgi:hypothetical protein
MPEVNLAIDSQIYIPMLTLWQLSAWGWKSGKIVEVVFAQAAADVKIVDVMPKRSAFLATNGACYGVSIRVGKRSHQVTISGYLEEDHRRIEHILQGATGSSYGIVAKLYEEFRGALLRHIGMEEKILFPAIRKANGGGSLPRIDQLHLDHGALAALLVPTPTAAIVNALQTILRRHNVIEEGSDGIYRQFEELPGIDTDSVLKKLQATRAVAMNPHVDNATAIESMRAAVQRAGYSLDL